MEKEKARSERTRYVGVSPPRDRDGSFNPQIVEKRQRKLNTGLDEQIIYLYARCYSYNDIHEQLQQMYGVDISPSTISRVTDRVLPAMQEWRSRPWNRSILSSF